MPPSSFELFCPSGLATVNTPYSSEFTQANGVDPVRFALIDGGLPPGLIFNPETGEITGTPTMSGSYPLTGWCRDDDDVVVTKVCLIVVEAVVPSNVPWKLHRFDMKARKEQSA